MLNVGAETVFTVIEMLLLDAVVGLGHAALLVMLHVTISPFESELLV